MAFDPVVGARRPRFTLAPSPPTRDPSTQQCRREDLSVAIVTWIERTYHRRLRQRGLGRLTPIEYETLNTAAEAV